MRWLILAESLAIVALAVAILLHGGTRAAPTGDLFPAGSFLADARPGEEATYRKDDGSTITFVVGAVDRGGPTGKPWTTVTRTVRDAAGTPLAEDTPSYRHFHHAHGLFPLLVPSEPGALDRVWVLRRIRRAETEWRGRKLSCWRVECIDPALGADQDAVEVWMHEDVPVYGILRWQRQGRTFECTSWEPKR